MLSTPAFFNESPLPYHFVNVRNCFLRRATSMCLNSEAQRILYRGGHFIRRSGMRQNRVLTREMQKLLPRNIYPSLLLADELPYSFRVFLD